MRIKDDELKKKDEELEKLKIENKFLEGFYNAVQRDEEGSDADA